MAALVAAHPEVALHLRSIGGGSRLSGSVDRAASTSGWCRRRSATSRSRSSRRVIRREIAAGRRGDVLPLERRLRAGQSRSQLQVRGESAEALEQAARQILAEVREGAGRGGRRTLDARPEARSWRCELNRGLAGTLGLSVGQVAQSLRPAFAGRRRRRLGGSDGQDARRDGAAVAGGARARWRTSAQLPLALPPRPGEDGGAHCSAHRAARPGGAHHALGRPGADRSPRPRAGGDGGGERRGALAVGGVAGHQPPPRAAAPAAGGAADAGRRGARARTRCSAASSGRSGWR